MALKKDLVVFLKDHLFSEKGDEMKDISGQFNWNMLPNELKTKKKVAKKRSAKACSSKTKKVNFDLNT